MGDEAKMRKQSWQACKRHEGEDGEKQNGRGEEGGGGEDTHKGKGKEEGAGGRGGRPLRGAGGGGKRDRERG